MAVPQERDVKLLLQKYQLSLTQLKDSLKIEKSGCDDIWMLRFVMSSTGDVVKASDNIKATLKWREEKKELLQVQNVGDDAGENRAAIIAASLPCIHSCMPWSIGQVCQNYLPLL